MALSPLFDTYYSAAFVPLAHATEFSWQLSEAERRRRFEQALAAGDPVERHSRA